MSRVAPLPDETVRGAVRRERDAERDPDAVVRPRADVDRAVMERDPLAHAEEPDAAERGSAAEAVRLEADAVVGDDEHDVLVRTYRQLDVDPACLGMLRHVRERLLRHAV